MTLSEALNLSRVIKRTSSGLEIDTDQDMYAGTITIREALATDWEPVIEKKKKIVVMYQAVFRYNYSESLGIPDILFANEFQARDHNKSGFIKLLTDRPIEVEIEE